MRGFKSHLPHKDIISTWNQAYFFKNSWISKEILLIKTPASPHKKGSQIGIPIEVGKVYVQAPKAIATASARAPDKPTIMYKYKSSFFLQLISIIALARIVIKVNSKGCLQSNETLNRDSKDKMQL